MEIKSTFEGGSRVVSFSYDPFRSSREAAPVDAALRKIPTSTSILVPCASSSRWEWEPFIAMSPTLQPFLGCRRTGQLSWCARPLMPQACPRSFQAAHFDRGTICLGCLSSHLAWAVVFFSGGGGFALVKGTTHDQRCGLLVTLSYAHACLYQTSLLLFLRTSRSLDIIRTRDI